jgi:hypothetical protein
MVEYWEEQLEELENEENELISRIGTATRHGDHQVAEDLEERLSEVLVKMDALENAISTCMTEPLDFDDDDTETMD